MMYKMEDQKKKALSEAIEDYFKNNCTGYSRLEEGNVKLTFDKDDTRCVIHLEKMYKDIGDWVNFERLTWLSKLLNTQNINLGQSRYTRGCDTCDYGSRDEIDITCDDINP